MLNKEVLYSLDDVAIQPSSRSDIDHRSECNVYIDGFLPIFTSPMPNVVDKDTFKTYLDAKINPILPRNTGTLLEKLKLAATYDMFAAYSMEEAEVISKTNEMRMPCKSPKVLIDIANGNMKKLFDLVTIIKTKYPNMILMVGNVANPETYRNLSDCGADYVRVSVGTGSACKIGNC